MGKIVRLLNESRKCLYIIPLIGLYSLSLLAALELGLSMIGVKYAQNRIEQIKNE